MFKLSVSVICVGLNINNEISLLDNENKNMIGLVANVIKFSTSVIKSIFTVFSTIGQVIVVITTGITALLMTIFESILKFFVIIYEDNIFIFTEELPNFIENVRTSLTLQWRNIENSSISVYSNVYSNFETGINTTIWSISAAFTVIGEVLLLLKKAFLLLGDTVWLLLTFIPVQLPFIIKTTWATTTNIITEVAIETYMILLELTNFLTDVPLESFIGMISTIIIVRLFVHFRESIYVYAEVFYWCIVRKFLYIYYVLYNYFIDSEIRVITQIADNQQLQMREMISEALEEQEITESPADSLCVVCQERSKCVLTLPCRHVCLCRECCTRLYGYQRTCPICRTFIYHSVNIYL